MIVEWALTLAPVAGWLINKQLDVNKQVAANTLAVEALTKTTDRILERVDVIYDHLINRSGPHQG